MASALDTAPGLGHASPMTDDAPRRPRGRPRIHADAKAAASARAAAHVKAKRKSLKSRTVYLDDETSARADALIAARGARSLSELVTALVREADPPEGQEPPAAPGPERYGT